MHYLISKSSLDFLRGSQASTLEDFLYFARGVKKILEDFFDNGFDVIHFIFVGLFFGGRQTSFAFSSDGFELISKTPMSENAPFRRKRSFDRALIFSKLKNVNPTGGGMSSLDRYSDYVPARTTIELRGELRRKSIKNQEISQFLNSIFDDSKWDQKRVAKYLGGERRFTYEAFLAICNQYEIDPVEVSLRGLEARCGLFNGSDLAQKIRKARVLRN